MSPGAAPAPVPAGDPTARTGEEAGVGPGAGRPAGRPGRTRTLRQQDARTGLTLISPTLVIVVAVVIAPLLWSILISFQRLRLINVGRAPLFSNFTLDNYARVFTSDELWSSVATTLVFTIGATALSIAVGLAAALALRRPFRGRSFVRASMLLPYVAPVVAVTFVWRILLNPEFGLVASLGKRFLGWDEGIPFLSQSQGSIGLFGVEIPVPTALVTVIVYEGWRYFPFAFLFLLARLQALSADIEEAAVIDGATPLQAFRHVILPQLMPVIAVLTVLRTIWTFNEFDDIFLLTGGTAGTQVVSIRVFDLLTVQRNVGAAAAQSVFLAAILVVLLLVYLRILRTRGGVESL